MTVYGVFFGIFILLVCCIGEHNSPNPQASASINESRQRGVFRSQLSTSKNSLIVGNRKIEIDQIWIEDVWFHDVLRRSNRKQIVIKLQNPKDLDTFLAWWALGLPDVTYGSSNGNISIRMDQDTTDFYTLYLYKYEEMYNLNSRKVIDSLTVEKVL